ncbi:3-hydroxyacyl-CoA dehydrogenase NAD-binding domain-containing protein [Pseudorhodoplanes sp.]|uniref:3-hydroxyacyl-CoA dehydrogenase NAD-binding domain-containing protein n=1 Tax=Pseudorhodoplanes sp. TaxID=1934341 RepID=UPI003D0ACFBD
MNVLNDASIARFEELVRLAIVSADVKGVIITSTRPEFVVGADLEQLRGISDPRQAMQITGRLSRLFREIEKSGKPFVAAINGTALGGGFEICLACHRRIAADNAKTQLGLPEVTLGLLPGAGGTQRLPRMIGLKNALPLLLEGKKLGVSKARDVGLIDEIVAPEALIASAKQWLLAEAADHIVKPWDKKDFRMPGGAVQSPGSWHLFSAIEAAVIGKTANLYPAPAAILSSVYDGCHVDIDTGLKIEARQFAKLAVSPQAQNMIRTLFYAIGDANKLVSRPTDIPVQKYVKVGVLGAGMMGAGIAYASAQAGLQTVLLDISKEAAEKGKSYSAALLEKHEKQGRIRATEREQVLARILATADYADLRGCEIVVEAVFENRRVKADVTKRAEAVLDSSAIFATNTSTLPITGLAENSIRPANFVGLHFFSPVERMPLVEVIRGGLTSETTIARAMDYVKRIRKTPIIVNDGRAFYTSRVFGTYVYEGMAMLGEGVSAALIENVGRMSGMPVPPLALMDEVSIELMYSVFRQTEIDLGKEYAPQPQDPVLIKMVKELCRLGRKSGQGFYDYAADGTKKLWPGLAEHFPLAREQPQAEEVRKRLMYIQSIEAARCLEEKIVDSSAADVGSILGWGFPAAYGGVVSQIDTVGVERFVEECDRLAQRHGARFAPPRFLRDRATHGERVFAA